MTTFYLGLLYAQGVMVVRGKLIPQVYNIGHAVQGPPSKHLFLGGLTPLLASN